MSIRNYFINLGHLQVHTGVVFCIEPLFLRLFEHFRYRLQVLHLLKRFLLACLLHVVENVLGLIVVLILMSRLAFFALCFLAFLLHAIVRYHIHVDLPRLRCKK